MNGILLKNLFREIKKTGTRFLSIFAICALGAAFFAGIRATSPDMQESSDKLFKASSLSDISVISSEGLTDDNIDDLRQIEGVEYVRPLLTIDSMMDYDEYEFNIHLVSLPIKENTDKPSGLLNMKPSYDIDPEPDATMNVLTLVSGRLPLDDTEVAIDATLAETYGMETGHKVVFRSNGITQELRVVGIVYSPQYVGIYDRGNSTIGSGTSDGYAFASGNIVNSLGSKLPMFSLLQTRYYEADIAVKGASEISAFTDEYESIVTQVCDAIEGYADTQSGTWYVNDRSANPGYTDYVENTYRIAAVGDVFPLIFFIVAALVCLTTMTRMVEEQRTEMGTLKALGYAQLTIMLKYFIYASIACVAGSYVGCVIGFKLFPYVILSAYSIMYHMPDMTFPYRVGIATGAIVSMLLCTCTATLAASVAALREVPATLMRPKAPKAGKRIFIEKFDFIWSKLNFTKKVTVRNLIRYKKRFFMSVIGIAGSCALLVTGFGLKYSIFGITDLQFNVIWNMDLQAYTYDSMTHDELAQLVYDSGIESQLDSLMYCYSNTCDIRANGERLGDVRIMGIDDQKALEGKITLQNKNKPCVLTDDGVIVTYKLAEICGIAPGDTIQIITANKTYDVKVLDVADNYIRNFVYMSAEYYQTIFGKEMLYNAIMINLPDSASTEQTEQVASSLLADGRMYTVETLSDTLEEFNNVLGILNYIVVVLIVGAALLTFVVMFNLTNINIGERKRELATLRVLGFYDSEMYSYVFRENNALAFIGALLGLVLGKFMHSFVIKTCEVDAVMFVRTADALSFVYAFALTVVFSMVVNLVMRKKVRAIDMVESLKSAE